jgi:hypothetical protein
MANLSPLPAGIEIRRQDFFFIAGTAPEAVVSFGRVR